MTFPIIEKRLACLKSSLLSQFLYCSFLGNYILQAVYSTVNILALETVTSKPPCITIGFCCKVCNRAGTL